MQWDNLKYNKGLWEDQVPENGHHQRFEKKLDEQFSKTKKRGLTVWKVAATLIVLISSVWFLLNNETSTPNGELTEASALPIDDAEYYYRLTIEKQFELLANYNESPEHQSMIEESKQMILQLEVDYKELEQELELTADYRVATAMISNYKSRIKILEELIQNIQYVNHLKEENHENLSI